MRINYYYLVCMTLLLCTGMTHAGPIKKCVDATGKITYTDKGCGLKNKTEDTYIGSIAAKQNIQNNTVTEQYRVSEIAYLTTETQTSCEREAVKQFSGKFPDQKIRPVVEYTEVVDRSIVWDEVSIVLKGTFTVENKSASTAIDFQCTTHKRKSGDQWDVEVKELATRHP